MSHSLELGRVTLHLMAETGDREQWRRRVRDVLGRVSPVLSLPPQVILVVRHMHDPRPRLVLGEHDGRNATVWRDEMQAWLDLCWRRALRPAAQPVPADAEAVWFADSAEWLACLSWDLQRGQTAHWWWQTWLRQSGAIPTSASVFRLWENAPRALPQALALLWRRDLRAAQALLMNLAPQQAAHIGGCVWRAYKLPARASARTLSTSAAPPTEDSVRARLLAVLPHSMRATIAGLPPEAAGLAALCLGLAKEPLHVRRALDAAQAPEGFGAGAQSDPQAGRQDPPRSVHAVAGAAQGASLPAQVPARAAGNGENLAQSRNSDSDPAADAPRAPSARGVARATPVTSEQRPLRGTTGNLASRMADYTTARVADSTGVEGPNALGGTIEAPLITGPDPASDDFQGAHAKAGIATQLGGIWYLVNVLADLDWVDDGAPELDGWHKLAGLAGGLLAEHAAAAQLDMIELDTIALDPVWQLLAEQSESLPASDFLARWLDRALPAVQSYLAVRLERPATMWDALRDAAQIYATSTHIDVLFPLDAIRLDLRMAGLDRNPGWDVALTRIVTLRYE
ncbi:MAG: hypothetical protein WDZ49_17090 [Litorilinea sp.]